MTANGGTLSEAQGACEARPARERVDARAEAIRNLRMAETMLARSNAAKAVQIEMHTRIAAVWSDLAYGEDFRQGLGTPQPCEGVSEAHSDSEDMIGYEPHLPGMGDRFKDRHGDMWTVIEIRHDGTPVLLMGDLQSPEPAARHTWNQLLEFWGPVTPWTGPVPETVPEPAQATAFPRTCTHEGTEYVYGVRYTDCEGDVWVIVDILPDGTPFAVAGYQAPDWGVVGTVFTIATLPTLVLRYGPLEHGGDG